MKKIFATLLLSGIMLFTGAGVSGALVSASAESGTTYYISSSDGNDAQAGTSESTAWKSFANLEKKVLTAGDKVLLRRGDVWQDRMEIMGNGTQDAWVEIGDYGDESLPKPTIRQNGGRNDIAVLVKDFYEKDGKVEKVNIRYIKIHDLNIEDTRMGIFVRTYATNNDGNNMHVDISDCTFHNIDSVEVMEELNKFVEELEAANPQPSPDYPEDPLAFDTAVSQTIGQEMSKKIAALLNEEKGNLPSLKNGVYKETGGGASEYIFPAAIFVGGKKDPITPDKPESIAAAKPALQYLSVSNCEMNECIAGVMSWFYAYNGTVGSNGWRESLKNVKIGDVTITGAVNGGLALECVDGGAVKKTQGKGMMPGDGGWGEIRNFRVLSGSYEPYHTFPNGTTGAIFESSKNFLITESEFSGMTNQGNADGCGIDFESNCENVELCNTVMQNNEGGAILIMDNGNGYHKNLYIHNNLMYSNLQNAFAAGNNRNNNIEVAYVHIYNAGNVDVVLENNVILMQESIRPGRTEARFKVHAVGPKPATEQDGTVNYLWKDNHEAFYEGGNRVPFKTYYRGKLGAGGKISCENVWLHGNVYRAMRITAKGSGQVSGTLAVTPFGGEKSAPVAFSAENGYVNLGRLESLNWKGVCQSAEITIEGGVEGDDYTLEFVPDTQVITEKISETQLRVTLTGESKAVFSDDLTPEMFVLHGKLSKHKITEVTKTGLYGLVLTLDKEIADGAYALTVKNDAYIAFFDKIFSGREANGKPNEESWYYPVTIKITSQPRKLNYEAGEEIDLMGMKLTMTTGDGEEISLSPAKCTIEGFDNTKAGKQTVTIRYRNAVTMFDVQVLKSNEPGKGGCTSSLSAGIASGAAIIAMMSVLCVLKLKSTKNNR